MIRASRSSSTRPAPRSRARARSRSRCGAGEHGVLIKRGDFAFEADKFVLKKGATITLKVELLQGKIQVKADGRVIGAKELPAVAAVGS